MSTLNFELDADGIALLTIDVPGRGMNVITPELTAELATLVERLETDASVKGAVFTSGKPGSFIAGADLKDLVQAFDQGIDALTGAKQSLELSMLFRRLESCGKPVAVAMNGLALGGGLELCLACHYRVLIDDPRAVIGLPEVKVGLLPGAGGTQRLPRLIGIPASLPLLLQGKSVKPAEALKLGIVHAVAPAGELVQKAREWVLANPAAQQPWDDKKFRVPGGAGPMAKHAGETFVAGNALTTSMTQGNYPAPNAIMSCAFEGTQVPIDLALRIESRYFGKLLSGAVARNMIRTLFINKGNADKLVNRPKSVQPSKVKKLGVLGAGMMGAGVAYVSAKVGIEVVLLDTDQANAEKGKAYSEGLLDKAIKRGKSTPEAKAELLARITPTTDYQALEGCDLIIEAVFEDRKIKADVTAKTEAVIAETAIFASNTSTLPITGLAKASKRPAQFIGIHFFSPVDKMPLVEIIVGKESSDEAIARSLDYVQQIKKTPIIVQDSPGFYTSRVFGTFTQEGLGMLLDGIEPALIENAAKQAGFPVGPLAVSDEVTLSLQQSIFKQQEADGLDDKYRGLIGRPVIDRMVDELKRPGRRFGAGFYDYPENGQKALWPGLREAFPPKDEQPDVEELKQRFLTIMALESARCFEEGVVTDPAEADVGSILGIGFPPWTGGTLSYIDTLGVDAFVEQCRQLAAKWGPRFEPSAGLLERAGKGQYFHPAAAAA